MPLMLVSMSHDTNSVIDGTIQLVRSDDQNEMQQDFFGHVMPMA